MDRITWNGRAVFPKLFRCQNVGVVSGQTLGRNKQFFYGEGKGEGRISLYTGRVRWPFLFCVYWGAYDVSWGVIVYLFGL